MMNWGARIAWSLTRRRYTAPVVADTPGNRWFLALAFGTPRKLINYLAVAVDYRRRRSRVRGMPYVIRVDPTSTCNLRCPLCPTGAGEIDRGRTFMRVELFEQIMNEFGANAFVVHLWVWGEPMLHPDLWKMVASASARGVATEVSTNLSVKLTDDQIDRLINAGLTWLIVSADAATPATYEKYRRGGNFDLVVANVRRFAARRRALGTRTPFLEWQFVPLRHNEHEMAAIERVARAAGADGVRFKPARIDKVTLASPATWLPRASALGPVVTDRGSAYHPFHCPFLWNTVTVHADGALAPCCETSSRRDDIGRFEAGAFAREWNGPAYVASRDAAVGRATDRSRRYACDDCIVFGKPERPPRPV